MKEYLIEKNYDLSGNEIRRITKLFFMNKLIPFGNLGGMTRLRELIILTGMHCCGSIAFRILIRSEGMLDRLYRKMRHL